MHKPVRVHETIELLKVLERHQIEGEKYPLGGYGAGIAFLTSKGEVKVVKVGKVAGSPSEKLYEMVSEDSTRVLIGHVRFPSPEFMHTSVFKETTQPYVTKCFSDLTVISAHNGKVANFKQLREKLKFNHIFESEKVEFIDSEVIPHLFEEQIVRNSSAENALDTLFTAIKGNNTAALLQLSGSEEGFLHLFHKGETRGLTVWTNKQGEILFCSRKAVAKETSFRPLLLERNFNTMFSVAYHEPTFWKHSFCIKAFMEK